MLNFIFRKIGYGFLVLFGVLTLVFMIFGLVPDPSRELAGQNESEEVVQAIRKKFNLDLPLMKRYLLFVNDLSPIGVASTNTESRLFNESITPLFAMPNDRVVGLKKPFLGRSYITNRSVSDILSDAFPGTMVLAFTALAFALVLGMFLGIISALHVGKSLDRFILVAASVGMSGPSFFMAIVIAWLGGFVWHDQFIVSLYILIFGAIGWGIAKMLKKSVFNGLLIGLLAGCLVPSFSFLPALNLSLPGTGLPMNGSMYAIDVWQGKYIAWQNLILPAITLGIRPLAVIAQLMRNSVLEVMQQDYIRTARAKGLSNFRVMTKHVIRNASNPVLTAASGWLASMLAGAVFVEFVFGWKGMGLEVFRSLEKNDLPVVMGAVLIIAVIFVVINILVDLLYAWIDPRVKVSD